MGNASASTWAHASATILVVGFAGAGGGCLGLESLEGRPCPCATEYVCCEATATCVPASRAASCAPGDAAASDATANETSASDTLEGETSVGEASSEETGGSGDGDSNEARGDDGVAATGPDAADASIDTCSDVVPASDAAPDGGTCATADDAGMHRDGAWLAMAASPLSPRDSALAVWAGDSQGNGRVVIWGGQSPANAALGDGALYDPHADRWSPMSSAGALPPAMAAAGVWTGKRVLVWGGSPPRQTDPVRAYDPQADAWSAGPPPTVFLYPNPFVAWTGKQMLLYSGQRGATYDPESGQWTAMDTTGAPCGSLGTAVWTGSLFIVWGGNGCGSNVRSNQGAAYDPATNAWTALPLEGAPSPRVSHNAVWTGSEMIIWGGLDQGSSPLMDGGAYDPVSRRWRLIGTELGSPPLFATTAFGFRGQMLLWGGYATQGQAPQGAQLDACTGQWWALPAAGQPPLRINHMGVWTGTEMVVWGGYDGSTAQYFVSGGRYRL